MVTSPDEISFSLYYDDGANGVSSEKALEKNQVLSFMSINYGDGDTLFSDLWGSDSDNSNGSVSNIRSGSCWRTFAASSERSPVTNPYSQGFIDSVLRASQPDEPTCSLLERALDSSADFLLGNSQENRIHQLGFQTTALLYGLVSLLPVVLQSTQMNVQIQEMTMRKD